MFILLDLYTFIRASCCVGRGPSELLWPGAFNAVKTALFMATTCEIDNPTGIVVLAFSTSEITAA